MYQVLKYCEQCYKLHGRPINKYRLWYECKGIDPNGQHCWHNTWRSY